MTVGTKLPEVTFKIMTPEGPKDMTTTDICANKKVAFFAVPGAFTPTCTAKHLPGYVDSYAALKAKGIESIACISVNDPFVMDAWGKSCGATEKILMLADGNGTFTKAVGLEMDAEGHGMGTRSQRYAMIVDNGIVSKIFIDKAGAFEVSSAEHILSHLV